MIEVEPMSGDRAL